MGLLQELEKYILTMRLEHCHLTHEQYHPVLILKMVNCKKKIMVFTGCGVSRLSSLVSSKTDSSDKTVDFSVRLY